MLSPEHSADQNRPPFTPRRYGNLLETQSEIDPTSAAIGSTPTSAPSHWAALGRLLASSLSYWKTIGFVLACGGALAFVRYLRAYLVKPLTDDVLLPLGRKEIALDGLEPTLLHLGLILGITILAQPIMVFLRAYWSHWIVASVRRDVDQAVAARFLAVPLSAHRSGTSGDLLSRAIADAQLSCQAVLLIYTQVLLHLQLLIGGLIALFLASWQLALVTIFTMPPLLIVVAYFGSRVQNQTRRRQQTQSDLSQRLVAILSGIKVIKAFQGQNLEEEAYRVEEGKFFRRNMKVVGNGIAARAAGEFLNPLAAIAVLGLGFWLSQRGLWGLSVGTLGWFAGILLTAYRPLKGLIQAYSKLMESAAGAQRLYEVLDAPGEPVDPPNARTLSGLHHRIRFRDVHFDYGERPVLAGIDLDVAPGEVIAVVGRTGAGKSTLADLVLRFHDPTRGAIEIDGVDLREIARSSFLDAVAVVTQEPFLFDVSVFENIRYGRHDASEAEVHAAARAASAEEFIQALPEGYDTPVGEFGLRLSGGQRQRLTIARAILADPAILVLDEATSALDGPTEAAVQRAIEGLRGERTIFLIAHRLSTIRQADRIVVLDEGRIAQIGDHAALLARPGLYRELAGVEESPSA